MAGDRRTSDRRELVPTNFSLFPCHRKNIHVRAEVSRQTEEGKTIRGSEVFRSEAKKLMKNTGTAADEGASAREANGSRSSQSQ